MPLDVDALLQQAGLAGLQDVPLTRIIPNPDNPRRDFDGAELEALAASIVKRGLLQPISLFPINGDGLHVIRFGERRFRAVGLAGLPTIKALISGQAVPEIQLVEQIIENDQRVDLSAFEMSEAIHALGRAGMTKAAIAAELGRSASTISLYAAVRDMPTFLQARANEISIRPLHDLYRLWRADPEPIVAFVAVTPAEEIDRRSVDALAARLSPAPASPDPVSEPGVVERPGPAALIARSPVREPAAAAMASDRGFVRICCEAGQGLLLFPAHARSDVLMVLLDGASTPIEIAATEVRIIAASLSRPA